MIRAMQSIHRQLHVRSARAARCCALLFGFGYVLVAVGCASGPALEPVYPIPQVGAGAATAANSAVSTVAGVRLVASVGTWKGKPSRLEVALPLEVEITNGGERPVSIRYDAFALVSDTGQRLVALPPFDIESSNIQAIRVSNPAATGFQVAPHHRASLPSYEPFSGTFPEDTAYFAAHHPKLRAAGLPTREMIEAALPEGVLLPGGRISGFLYLVPLPPEAKGAVFELELSQSPKGRSFGRINIPFRAR